MPRLPRGTVSLLFTDVEGSTQLQRRLGERYREVVAEHRRLLEEAIKAHGGRVVDRQTESFFAVFPRMRDAVAAAAAAQRAIAGHRWPEGVAVKVRMGLHAGEPELDGNRYVGLAVSRAARICSAGHGGQVLLSSAARALLTDDDQAKLRNLGSHSLKDFPAPEPISALVIDELPARFPPLRTGARRPRWKLLVPVGAVVVAGAATAIALTVIGGETTLARIGPTSIGIVDPSSEKLVGEIRLDTKPALMAAGEEAVWLADQATATLIKIDPERRGVVRRSGLGADFVPSAVAAGEGSVWVAGRIGRKASLLELDPEFGALRDSFALEPLPRETLARNVVLLAIGDGAVWILETTFSRLSRLDPKTDRRRVVAEGVSGQHLAVGNGAVWTGNQNVVTRIDVGTGVASTTGPIGQSIAPPGGVGAVWLWWGGFVDWRVWRLDPATGAVRKAIPLAGPAGAIAVQNADALWIGSRNVVFKIDPRSARVVRTIRIGYSVATLGLAKELLWTAPLS